MSGPGQPRGAGETGRVVSGLLRGADDTPIAVRAAGDPGAPPIVFVHGWGGSSAGWSAQFDDRTLTASCRLWAMDLRGHGGSAAPDPAFGGYRDSATWAVDLAAVVDHAVAEAGGRPSVLVGSSYGGLVITDLLRERGGTGVAALVLAGALTEIGPGRPGGAVGTAMSSRMRELLSEDPAVAVPAVVGFVDELTATPLDGPRTQRYVGDLLRVPPSVRLAMFRRTVDNADLLAGLRLPTLVLHGTADTVVAPSAAEYAAGKIPGAVLRWFSGVGHLPFVERVQEFDAELRAFTGHGR